MANIKVINKGQNGDLIGGNFTNDTSETVFNLGDFGVTTNLQPRVIRNYNNELSGFVKPITLETLEISEEESTQIYQYTNKLELNLDKSDLLIYARYGSLRELFRISINSIILKYPASLYSNTIQSNSFTLVNYSFNPLNNTCDFQIPIISIDNRFGLLFRNGNQEILDDNPLSNLNLSYSEYVVWREDNFSGNSFNLIGFTGQTNGNPFIYIKANGNPFPELTGLTTNTRINFHIKPAPINYNKFYKNLNPVEKFLLEKRIEGEGYLVKLKAPYSTDTGSIIYFDNELVWKTSDGYNVDTNNAVFTQFIESLNNIGEEYDRIKSDLIFRFLTPSSIKDQDTTDDKKVEKLLRIYGREFDEIKKYIDAITYVYSTTYNKKKNIPDILVKNYAKSLGWDVFTLVDDDNLVDSFFSTNDLSVGGIMLPSEIDIELWRRILINTNYFFKNKGTRASFKSMLLLLGIPEPFINISEYVYTVDEKIIPDNVTLTLEDLPSKTLPYNSNGYPVAPQEQNSFFFQISGDTDSGQAYIDNFRNVGFSVNRTIDNKKSWNRDGYVVRKHYTTPDYIQFDSDLIINTKEIDVTLDTSRGIEYDVYTYNYEQNYPIYSTGITQAYVYINIASNFGVSANTFTIPEVPWGEIQLNFNGIQLKKGTFGTDDYYMSSPTTVTLNNGIAQTYSNGEKDIITLTYMTDRLGEFTSGNTISYMITPITPTPNGTKVILPTEPNGDVQLTVNGITLTKSTSLFTGDYVINPLNRKEILITNTSLQAHISAGTQIVSVSYFTGATANGNLYKETEVYRVDSLFTSKVFYNSLLQKTVYVLNYTAFDVDSIKVVLNGITLQNGIDFILNSSNKSQVYLNGQIRIGDLITVYYVLNNEAVIKDKSIISTIPVSNMTFLEYLDMVNKRLINTKTRKIVTNNEGGFYPTIWKLYEDYYRRSFINNHLASNGYNFANLFPFTNKFNTAFQRFLTQLLPATIILRNSGFLIRNTVFTKQKFTYKRGLNFNSNLNWFGDDGSEFRMFIPEPIVENSWNDLVCVQELACTLEVNDVQIISEYNPPSQL